MCQGRAAALGSFLRHLGRGERIAQRVALRQVELAPDARASRFFKSQARQESQHALVFETGADWLDAPRQGDLASAHVAYETELDHAVGQRDFRATVVGTQIVLEALGEILLARLDRGLDRHGAGLRGLRRRILAQEAAHHAFGEALARRWQCEDARRLRLETGRFRVLAGRLIDSGAETMRGFAVPASTIRAELDARLAPWMKA